MEKGCQNERRRALNIIWTAARDYSFEPQFMAFDKNKTADFYLNTVIGLVHKWYDPDILSRLFKSFEGAALQETYDGLLWLGLENSVYEKEKGTRPALEDLREEYSRQIVDMEAWTTDWQLVPSLRLAKCQETLGLRPFLTARDRKLLNALSFNGTMTTQDIADAFLKILRDYFRFRAAPEKSNIRRRRRILPLIKFRLFSYTGILRDDDQDNGQQENRKSERRRSRFSFDILPSGTENTAYAALENAFGKPVYSREESIKLERQLCTGNHLHSHLYFAEGAADPGQQEKNRKYYTEHLDVHNSSIARLSSRIRNTMLVCSREAFVKAACGTLDAGKVWRIPCLDDNRVFVKKSEEEAETFTVDLMLDASASQSYRQEIVAAQGYIIAESLSRCKIPVQVYSFNSFYGYTVIRMFRGYTEENKNGNIFSYSAAGWNRDGLAFRGAGHLIKRSQSENRLLIVLTDADPNDDRNISGKKRTLARREYSGKEGVLDAAEEVRQLEKQSVKVIGVFTGQDENLKAAKQIYGNDFVRITEITQLADAVGSLIQRQIRNA